MNVLRFPSAPRYDASKDGNPFRWIVATAPKVRQQRQDVMDDEALRRVLERRAAQPPRP